MLSCPFLTLKKNNLTGTTEQLQKELAKATGNGGQVAAAPKDIEMGNALATYKSDGDPSSYDEAYNDLEVFVENSLDGRGQQTGQQV